MNFTPQPLTGGTRMRFTGLTASAVPDYVPADIRDAYEEDFNACIAANVDELGEDEANRYCRDKTDDKYDIERDEQDSHDDEHDYRD